MSNDEQLQHQRLKSFLAPMLPIAVAFLCVYAASALWLRSVAFAGGAGVVAIYVGALVVARRWVKRGQVVPPALLTGYSLVLIDTLGAPFLHFAGAALMIIPVTAAALVIGFVGGRQLKIFLGATLVAEVVILTFDVFLPPFFEQPPRWLQQVVTAGAVLTAACLAVRLIWADSERLRHAVRARDEFLSVAAHELRTPLTAVNLALDGVARRSSAGAANAEWVLRQTESSRRAVRRLNRLVEDLLDMSRIGAGRLELSLEEVELGALVREVAERFAESTASALVVEAPQPVVGRFDRSRLEQVLMNLVGNALKYGEGKPVTVAVSAEAGRARLEVRDQGIGIPPESQKRIFERFHRASTARNYGGLGLGLWISRDIVEAHGGRIAVTSAPGSGSAFRVELPLAPVETGLALH